MFGLEISGHKKVVVGAARPRGDALSVVILFFLFQIAQAGCSVI